MNGAVLSKNKKTLLHLLQLRNCQMIKHDSNACMSYCLLSFTTNIRSMQRSMKVDRLGYLNLCSISELHCSLPSLEMFSLNLPSWWMLRAVSPHRRPPCWPAWLMVQWCHFNKCVLACKRSPVDLNWHLSDFIDVMFALTHSIVKHL